MSLVGSLEDLGLGDILQIVSLSRKSGLLLIQSEDGEGRIVFREGLVRASYIKGGPEELGGLLVGPGFVSPAEFEQARELARARGVSLEEVVGECTSLTPERLDSLRREHVERSVLEIFSWGAGEFSFEVRDQIDARDREILMPTGINAQFLTMEATRLGDEGGAYEVLDESSADDDPLFSGEAEFADSEPANSGAVESVIASDDLPDPEAAHSVLAQATAQREAPGLEIVAAAEPAEASRGGTDAAPCVIAIDPKLSTLEWQKAALADLFERVHIFQNSESGLDRIRQYLRRGKIPVILISIDLVGGDLVRRLKLLAPSMPVLVNTYEGSQSAESMDAVDAVVTGPAPAYLANQRKWDQLEDAARAFGVDVASWAKRAAPVTAGARQPASAPVEDSLSEGLEKLRALSERIRDPSMHGEVLSLVLEFASQRLDRVAMFMIRDDTAVGIAQRGLDRRGGPSDDEFRNLEFPAMEVEWFQSVIESGAALHSGPTGKGDHELLARLGELAPSEAYVAPITSGARVVALLYADNASRAHPVGDTTILEIALHEAGLALERALLERALSRVSEPS
jgi:hypothetical protein